MPYICLARTDLPDGTVQILDLKPNSSNRNLIYEPEGQTKYVNRALNEPVHGTATGTTYGDANGLQAYLADRVEPVGTPWTTALLAQLATDILAYVDAGTAFTTTTPGDDLDALIAAVNAGSSLSGGASTGVLTEILAVLAGRGYVLPTGSQKMTGGAWSAVQAGNFTEDVLHYGTTWQAGEIVPTDYAARIAGGDTVAVETKPTKYTYDGTHFQISLGTGHLLTFASGVTLFPDSDLVPHHPWEYQGTSNFPETANARVVTVYANDGTLLA
jgi:hypothetical protein